jgi:hypothetical protein
MPAAQAFLAEQGASSWLDFAKFPVKFPVCREFGFGDRFRWTGRTTTNSLFSQHFWDHPRPDRVQILVREQYVNSK